MKDDKVCFNKTWTYLVLLVAVVFGAFYVMKYSSTQKLGGTPRAAATPATIRYQYLGTDNKVVNPDRVAKWAAGLCEYRLRSYREGAATLWENAYTGFISDGAVLTESTTCYPYIYAQRDIHYNYKACVTTSFQFNEYCRGRVNTHGDVKYGSLFYSYNNNNEIYQQTSTYHAVAGQTGNWWVVTPGAAATTSKVIIFTKRMFEGFPAFLAGPNTAFTPAVALKRCTYNGTVVKFAAEPKVQGDYFMDTVDIATNVVSGTVYPVKQEAGATDRLTAIQCIPTSTGVANAVSWRSNGGVATDDLNLQTCKDNAVKTYTVMVGGVSQLKTIKATCKYKTGSGTEVSVSYGDFILNSDGTPTTTKCDCDETRDPVLTYPTFVERP